jgi:uncharacterized cupredoxin-like copper-binding protein
MIAPRGTLPHHCISAHTDREDTCMKLRSLPLPLALLVAGLLLGACSPAGASSTALTVVVREGAYVPVTLEAPAGKPIRLTLDNQDAVPHQLAIADIALATQGGGAGAMAGMDHEMPDGAPMPPVHVVAAPGAKQSVDFTPTQAGNYTLRCLEPGHIELGTLTVTRR